MSPPLSLAVALALALALALLLGPIPAAAQERPSEEDLFGKPSEAKTSEAKPPPSPPAEAAPPQEPARPTLEGEPGAERRLAREVATKEEMLKLGGVLYLRSNLFSQESTAPARWTFTAPSLTDVYLDARPAERVRGFALGRMFFDPTQSASTTSILPTAARAPNPRGVLDQLWLRFDVERTAFVTVGRQHVKWGVGRFWNPTDYLHAVRRDPLAVFDERTGTTMLRVHVPWEKRGWNLYGVAIAEPLVTQPTSALGAAPQQPAAPA